MRPTKIVMSAFGPYAGQVILNMEELGTKGLYLITGNTGAGKTTIFDAITFALYGRASGQNRDATMFRSKYAKPDTLTEVSLTFLYDGKEYTIKRNPQYIRPAKRGGGETIEKPGAELTYPDGRVITKLSEVDNAIRNLLGLDQAQFTQIAMLAQGAFMNLLFADTKTRGDIFRDIFRTLPFERFQRELKEEEAKVRDICEKGRFKIETLVSRAEGDGTEPERLEDAKNGRASAEETDEIIAHIVERDRRRKTELDEELEQLNQKQAILLEQLTLAKDIDRKRSAFVRVSQELEQKLERLDLMQEELKNALAKKVEIDENTSKIAVLKESAPQYDELEELEQQFADAAKEQGEIDFMIRNLQEQNIRLAQELKELREEQEHLSDVSAELIRLEHEIDVAKERYDNICDLLRMAEGHKKNLEEGTRLQKVYREMQAKLTALQSRYQQMYQAYLDEQAGIIAETLEEGKPCPVCGSVSHPQPAVKSAEAPDKVQLEEAKQEVEHLQERTEHASRAAGDRMAEIQGERNAILLSIKKLSVEITESEDILQGTQLLESLKAEVQTEGRSLIERQKELKNRQERKRELDQKIPVLTARLEDEKRREGDLRVAQEMSRGKAEHAEKLIQKLRQSLQFDSRESLAETIERLENANRIYGENIERAQVDVAHLQAEVAEMNGTRQALEKELHNAGEYNQESLADRLQELENLRSEKDARRAEVIARITNNAGALEDIHRLSESLRADEAQYQLVRSLSDTANGKLSGKDKITLEAYVQAFYFDRVIAKANVRFMVMSEGQYELKRSVNASDRKSRSGLELSVIDHYNGSERSVKSLSGGESFEAALSLALGLSDEIQSNAGGVKMDTMFVDEGFGSLDDESLDKAIRALTEISEGNRLIGIISHVGELKNRIERQIVVTKEQGGGSRIEVR